MDKISLTQSVNRLMRYLDEIGAFRYDMDGSKKADEALRRGDTEEFFRLESRFNSMSY